MNLVWAFLITLAVAAIAITAMQLVRRRAPEGSYFVDGDRASGVFGVIATGLSVLLGFIVFLAFTSYDESRLGAETEALKVAQQASTAQFFPASASATLTGELVCYARFVVNDEWPRMEDGTIGNGINPWSIALYKTIRTVAPQTASEQAAYDRWLEQAGQREEARLDRVHGAEGVLPMPIWVVLFFIAGIIFVYMLFFADPGEGPVTQSMLMGGVASVITVLFLLVGSLDRPFHDGVGGLQPVTMERTLEIIDEGLTAIEGQTRVPCDANGVKTGS